jgi:hypothetical protein
MDGTYDISLIFNMDIIHQILHIINITCHMSFGCAYSYVQADTHTHSQEYVLINMSTYVYIYIYYTHMYIYIYIRIANKNEALCSGNLTRLAHPA